MGKTWAKHGQNATSKRQYIKVVCPLDRSATEQTPWGKAVSKKHKKAETGSLEFLQPKTFQRLRRSLDAAQSKVTAHIQIEAKLSGSKSELMKSPTLASFHFYSMVNCRPPLIRWKNSSCN